MNMHCNAQHINTLSQPWVWLWQDLIQDTEHISGVWTFTPEKNPRVIRDQEMTYISSFLGLSFSTEISKQQNRRAGRLPESGFNGLPFNPPPWHSPQKSKCPSSGFSTLKQMAPNNQQAFHKYQMLCKCSTINIILISLALGLIFITANANCPDMLD